MLRNPGQATVTVASVTVATLFRGFKLPGLEPEPWQSVADPDSSWFPEHWQSLPVEGGNCSRSQSFPGADWSMSGRARCISDAASSGGQARASRLKAGDQQPGPSLVPLPQQLCHHDSSAWRQLQRLQMAGVHVRQYGGQHSRIGRITSAF